MSKLKLLPSVSLILEEIKGKLNFHENYLKLLINRELDFLRHKIISEDLAIDKEKAIDIVTSKVKDKASSSLLNIINGTGIVLHTGFGRAPFNGERLKEVADKIGIESKGGKFSLAPEVMERVAGAARTILKESGEKLDPNKRVSEQVYEMLRDKKIPFENATQIFREMITKKDFDDFLTLPLYEKI